MDKYNLLAQGLNQLAFIGSIIGGFSVALAAAIISKSEKSKVASWTVGFAITTSSSMMVCVIGWSLAAFRLHFFSATEKLEQLDRIGYKIDALSEYLGLLFLLSILLFFVSLALSGWNISRKLGIITTVIVVLCAIAGFLVIIPFL